MKTIFKTSRYYTKKDEQYIKDYLKENGEKDITDEMVQGEIEDAVEQGYCDASINLDVDTEGRVIAIADLGFWNGRKQGYKLLGRNISGILASHGCDDFKLYYDGFNVRFEGAHHDGRHYILFRELKEDRDTQKFLDKIYAEDIIDNKTLNYYSKSLRKYVKGVYGW